MIGSSCWTRKAKPRNHSIEFAAVYRVFSASVLSVCLLAFLPAFSLYQQCAFCLYLNLLFACLPVCQPSFWLPFLFCLAKIVSLTAFHVMQSSVFLSFCLYICLSACLDLCLPARLPICFPVHTPACLSICLFVLLSACLSALPIYSILLM